MVRVERGETGSRFAGVRVERGETGARLSGTCFQWPSNNGKVLIVIHLHLVFYNSPNVLDLLPSLT